MTLCILQQSMVHTLTDRKFVEINSLIPYLNGGEDDDKKFILFHYSILSEGINVRGLTHSVLLRNLPVIEMAQTIGRVIRLHKYDYQDIQNNKISAGDTESYRKPHGIINVPVNSKSSKATRNRLEKLIQLIFEDGLPAHSFATK